MPRSVLDDVAVRRLVRRAMWAFRRGYVRPLLRLQARVEEVDKGVALVYCAGCTCDEVQRVRDVEASLLDAVAVNVARYLDTPPFGGKIRVLCFGSAFKAIWLPVWLKGVLRDNKSACWHPSLPAVILQMAGVGPSLDRVRAALVHELAHALMGALAHPYRYPRVIIEAFGMSIECDFGHTWSVRGITSGPGPYPWPLQRISGAPRVYKLLTTENDAAADGSFHRASVALLAFLARLNRAHHGVLNNWLAEIRRQRLNGLGTYAWLLQRLNMNEEQFEGAFTYFVRCGEVPVGTSPRPP